MGKGKDLCKDLQKLLKKGKIDNPYEWTSHLIRFSVNNGNTQFAACQESQIELAFEFLKKNKVDFILIEELGRVKMSYNWLV